MLLGIAYTGEHRNPSSQHGALPATLSGPRYTITVPVEYTTRLTVTVCVTRQRNGAVQPHFLPQGRLGRPPLHERTAANGENGERRLRIVE